MGALALATTILTALPPLIQAGMDVMALLESTNGVIAKAQAEGRDPTDAEWETLDSMLTDLRKQAAG